MQSLGFDQRHVAVEDQGRAAVAEERHRLLHGMAGSELQKLAHERQVRCLHGSLHRFGAVPRDDDDATRPQIGGGLQNMLQ